MADFRFRLPAIDELTATQKIALVQPKPLLVTGGPGSGKTVVSIFRFLKQVSQNQNSIFFTFNRTLMSSIRGTLRQRARILLPNLSNDDVKAIIENNIGSIHEWYADLSNDALTNHDEHAIKQNFIRHISNRENGKYKELFIDESQDLRPAIIKHAYKLSEKVSCSADRSQDLQGHYTEPADDMIFEILNTTRATVRQELIANFRNTREIFAFARGFVPEDINVQNLDLKELPEGEVVDVRSNLSEADQLDLLLEIITQNPNSNLGIIVHSSNEIIKVKEHLEANDYSCDVDASEDKSFSYYYNGMFHVDKKAMESRLRTPFIITYESCKGLEFDTVILPFFNSTECALTKVKKNNDVPQFDAKGKAKNWTTPSHYYVAATRARRQLYVLYDSKPPILGFYKESKQHNIFDDLPF